MIKDEKIENILLEICLDNRINDGVFNIENDIHMEVLREHFLNKGIEKSVVIEYSNRVLEGKFPLRQAYSQKGILCTFPTPEYKTAAIKRGTHFEKDPTAKPQNVFGGNDKNNDKDPKNEPPTMVDKDTKTELPVSQNPVVSPNDSSKNTEKNIPPQIKTTAAPQQISTDSSGKNVESPDKVIEPDEMKEPVKSPEEKEAEKKIIKNMLKTDDYILEEKISVELYDSAKRASVIISSFINGCLPKKADVKIVLEELQLSIDKFKNKK